MLFHSIEAIDAAENGSNRPPSGNNARTRITRIDWAFSSEPAASAVGRAAVALPTRASGCAGAESWRCAGLEGGVQSLTLLAQVFHARAQFLLVPAKFLDDVAKS